MRGWEAGTGAKARNKGAGAKAPWAPLWLGASKALKQDSNNNQHRNRQAAAAAGTLGQQPHALTTWGCLLSLSQWAAPCT